MAKRKKKTDASDSAAAPAASDAPALAPKQPAPKAPEPASDANGPSIDLEQQVDALLRDVATTEQQIRSSMKDPSPDDVDLEAVKAEAELAATVDKPESSDGAGDGADLDALLRDVQSAVESDANAGASSAGPQGVQVAVANAPEPEVAAAAGDGPEVGSTPTDVATDVDTLVDDMVASAQREGMAGLAANDGNSATSDGEPAAVMAEAAVAAELASQDAGENASTSTHVAAAAVDATTPANTPATIATHTASVEDVDAQIATATEALIAHEPVQQGDSDASAAIVEAEASAPATPVTQSLVSTPKGEHANESTHTPLGKGTLAASGSPEHGAPNSPRDAVVHGPSMANAAARSMSDRLARALSPAAVKAATAMNKPLAKKPRAVRDAVGWIAANTLFLGVCLWAYVLFVRGPHAADAQPIAFDFQRSGLPRPEVHDEHGAAGDTHAGGDAHGAKDDGHGDKKDDGHGDKKDAKKEARKPLIGNAKDAFVVNNATDPKKRAEAAKKKDSGGKGGGH